MSSNGPVFTKTHEWVRIEGDLAVVGISDFAVQLLTDLVYIDLPAVGQAMEAGQTFGEVESVKAVSDLYAPASGEIVEVNSGLADDLAVLSEDAMERGWILKMKLANPSELEQLMDAAAYEAHCNSESH